MTISDDFTKKLAAMYMKEAISFMDADVRDDYCFNEEGKDYFIFIFTSDLFGAYEIRMTLVSKKGSDYNLIPTIDIFRGAWWIAFCQVCHKPQDMVNESTDGIRVCNWCAGINSHNKDYWEECVEGNVEEMVARVKRSSHKLSGYPKEIASPETVLQVHPDAMSMVSSDRVTEFYGLMKKTMDDIGEQY